MTNASLSRRSFLTGAAALGSLAAAAAVTAVYSKGVFRALDSGGAV